ncbi:HD domain-containing protein [Deinococcus frigens]|uniref:HD domain-containing protein n=1 Tax=Deinococcus frigens TaxID=249403 RepID=UPI000558AB18|nr:HD domain-containing protein [Deinococcus frigens]
MTAFPLTDRFVQALHLAHQWHSGQYRKGTAVPYVSHLLGVASIALEFGASEDEAIAALLHDALKRPFPEQGSVNMSKLLVLILALVVGGAVVAHPVSVATETRFSKQGELLCEEPTRLGGG